MPLDAICRHSTILATQVFVQRRASRTPALNPKNSMVATLTAGPDVYCLSDGADTPADLVGEIFAAHVKSRQEKAFARDLAQRRVGYFLPMYERIAPHTRHRRYLVEEPLFPGYVFFAGDEHTPPLTMSTGRVCKTIRIPDQQRVRKELKNLFVAWRVNPRMERMPYLVKGALVRVYSGPLEGTEGHVVRRKESTVLILPVNGFGQASIEIDADFLEPA